MRDQSSPHASHCSCKYEVEALRREVQTLTHQRDEAREQRDTMMTVTDRDWTRTLLTQNDLIDSLKLKVEALTAAGMAFEEDRQRQAKISMRQHDVVEAAREVRRSYQSDAPRGRFMRLRIDALAAALSDHDRALAALDKATEVRG